MATRRRLERLNKTLMKEIANVIMTDIKDPRLLSMVSVMDVEMSEDMRHAKVVVSIYGERKSDNHKTFEALESSAGYISSVVSKALRLRYAPTLQFEWSHAMAIADEMGKKIKDAMNSIQKEGQSSREEDHENEE
ncbi:30S ribosome-binding factor RbfA [Thermospira aquatica]|uniref:Ribosome-binding factor A n=1 Tax=Thermospira aquatica TaxID=2828656 RepID=A0AAX3BDF0_9SPIR|nr:30S ribosome-binding factor RbfA [Thermospira aquatica]URA10349.1 30S ribosome-binding factor RbfA [Thermospira aquatica]